MIVLMNEQQRFGQLIREGMERRGITGKELAVQAGWSQSVVSDIVRGDRATTPPDVARTLSAILGIPLRQMAIALGYLDPEDREPGVAHVIREGDPLAEIVAMLEGAGPHDLALVKQFVMVLMGSLRRS